MKVLARGFSCQLCWTFQTVFKEGHQEWMLMCEEVRGKNFNKDNLKLGNGCDARTKNFALET